MPLREFSREQAWLLPPTLDDMLPEDHGARFVAVFVDSIDRSGWEELGVSPQGEERGAAAYHPGMLLGVWLYGFMTGVRRKLETACKVPGPKSQAQSPRRWTGRESRATPPTLDAKGLSPRLATPRVMSRRRPACPKSWPTLKNSVPGW